MYVVSHEYVALDALHAVSTRVVCGAVRTRYVLSVGQDAYRLLKRRTIVGAIQPACVVAGRHIA